ncbi:MAG: ParB N-terminal domain-containing protein [Alistipes senegalensis]|nr:ParB N-terminal domain-containing protein [Oxalobacter formigenes]MCM1280935.1 ParB N-terminal domain-containing protein [Alistipes senegalensis]
MNVFLNDEDIKIVSLNSLYFDEANPWLPWDVEHSQQSILEYFARTAIEKLVSSIAKYDYFPGEPLIVVPRNNMNNEWTVVDGNRRLTALKILENPDILPSLSGQLKNLTKKARHRPQNVPVIIDKDNTAEQYYERLHELEAALPDWLRIDREALIDRIIAGILAAYCEMPSPEEIEGINTGLDFLGLLLTEGGDNGLYETTIEQLESEIYQAVSNLQDNEIIALLLPMEEDDIEDLITDRKISEWPHFLLQGTFWRNEMLGLLLDQVEPRDRYES